MRQKVQNTVKEHIAAKERGVQHPFAGQNTQHVWHLEVFQSKPAATLSPGSRFTLPFYVQLATSSLKKSAKRYNCDSIALLRQPIDWPVYVVSVMLV